MTGATKTSTKNDTRHDAVSDFLALRANCHSALRANSTVEEVNSYQKRFKQPGLKRDKPDQVASARRQAVPRDVLRAQEHTLKYHHANKTYVHVYMQEMSSSKSSSSQVIADHFYMSSLEVWIVGLDNSQTFYMRYL